MKTTRRHQRRLIRAVYPNGREKRGYHIILTMHNAKPLTFRHWLTKWAASVTPQAFGSY